MGRLSDWLRGRTPGGAGAARPPRVPFKLRYGYFRELLAANDQVLEAIADLEDKLSGEHVFGLGELRARLEAAALAAFVMVKNLNLISEGRYPDLYDALERLNAVIQAELGPRRGPAGEALVVPLAQAVREAVDALGGKMANLGEVRNRVGLRVPDGFVVTTAAFERLMAHEGLGERIGARLALAGDEPHLVHASAAVRELVLGTRLPADLAAALGAAAADLCARAGRPVRLAVRSSAVGEDSGHATFAGQYQTMLNVDPADLASCYLTVVASLYRPGAIAYRRHRGLREEDTRMAVGVIELVDAVSAGVMFTRDPARPHAARVLVEAVPGQGASAVDGAVAPDRFVLEPGTPPRIVERVVADKPRKQVAASWGGLCEVELGPAERRQACIGDPQLLGLGRIAAALEAHFAAPQDVEWALAGDGTLYVLQSRPMAFAEAPAPPAGPEALPDASVLLRGVCACPGVGAGVIARVESEADLERVGEDAVLVARHSSAGFVRVMRRVRAIVTEVGGQTGHMAIVAREFGVPTVLGAAGAAALAPGLEVTVDATRGLVYRGRVAALLATAAPRRALMDGTPVARTLERVAPHVCPLTLVDPAAPDFAPSACRSLHDITRFVHERVFAEMFYIGDDVKRSDEVNAVRLRARLPIDVYVFDLGGAVRPEAAAAREVDVADLASVPLRAFVAGLSDPGIRWDRPRPVSVGGFLSVLGESMVGPPPSKHGLGRRSFAMASDTYLNFSTRAGYHFSTLDTYCGRSINKNYVHFRFTGGAAAEARRARRARFVAGVMQRLGFAVQARGDLVVARLHKYPREQLEALLRTLGRLTVCCRQLDMLMDSDDVVASFVEAFFAGDYERFA